MRIRFYNALVMTMEEGREIFQGEVWTRDDRIEAVLKTGTEAKEGEANFVGNQGEAAGGRKLPRAEDQTRSRRDERRTWDREIDCQGNLLMPGFKDAHTHSSMTFLRSYADDLPLQEWLQTKIFPMEEKLDDEDIYHFGRLAILEYLTSGITGICDMYLRPGVMAKACVDVGMRCNLVSGLNNFTSSLEQVEEEFESLNHFDPLIRYSLGFHAEYTCSKELLQGLSELAHQKKAPVFTHLCETEKEVLECKERYGMTPPVFLNKMGIFDYGGGGYHCIYLSDEDVRIFQKRKLFVITNPASNLKLASGIAPLAEYAKKGIPIAIGTDGPASNNCLDFFRETFLTCGLSKVKDGDASCMGAAEVLKMATINGAKVMGFQDNDVIFPGKFADVIMIDLHQPNMMPKHNLAKNLIYSGSKSNVKMTMIGGKILYEDGAFKTGSGLEEIYLECEKSLKKMKAFV